MIIKIKAALQTDGWFYFDNAEEVFYSGHQLIREFFHDSMGQDADVNILAADESTSAVKGSIFRCAGPASSNGENPGTFLSFRRNEKTYEIWLDTEAYLMTDAGKTIERIS